MFFDAVLTKSMRPVFNGTPDETKDWLVKNLERAHIYDVCVGRTMQIVPTSEYLANINSLAELIHFFSVPGRPVSRPEMFLFWESLDEESKVYFRTVSLR
jgi:hypothetical protein